jgi:flagellar L-ring protein precursor FlgH
MNRWFVTLCALLCGGCAADVKDIGREPHMTPVGTGLQTQAQPVNAAYFPAQVPTANQSLWEDGRADLFRDARAMKVGDLVTVVIFINDKATFDNTTDRSRQSKSNYLVDLATSLKHSTKLNANADLSSSTETNGKGTIDRSEKIQLSVAAVVTGVLPNGNLLINGSQEVRVNFELRLLTIAGIVRPRDISHDNTISYDKIAEARISYGGRGRITEVQQPAWGQQILDIFMPY